MTSTDKPAMRISGPAELITAVPYLLGFHPHDSVVLVGLADSQLVVTARLDLDDAADHHVLADTITAMVRGGTTDLIATVYAETEHPAADADLPHRAVIDLVIDTVDLAGGRLTECLLVGGARWWSYSCKNPTCCPPEGRMITDTTTVFQAEAVVAGLTAAATRDDLADVFTPPNDAADLREAIARHEQNEVDAALRGSNRSWAQSVIRALFVAHRDAQAGVMPSDDDVARFGVALRSYAVRDAAWLAVDDGQLPGLELWANLARRLPSPYNATPLFLAAWSAFREGNGAVASIAAEKAVRSVPGYSAAELLLAALAHGFDPRRLPPLRL